MTLTSDTHKKATDARKAKAKAAAGSLVPLVEEIRAGLGDAASLGAIVRQLTAMKAKTPSGKSTA